MSVSIMHSVWMAQLPESISNNKRSTVKIVLLKLADNSNDNGKCWPSMDKIAHETELSVRSVVRAINDLKESNLILVNTNRVNGIKHNTYFINIPLLKSLEVKFESKPSEENDNPFMSPSDNLSKPSDTLSKKDASLSLKPSLTINEPSLKKPLPIDKSNRNILSKDLKDNSSRKFIDQLNQSHYPLCNIAMEELEYLKNDYQNIYLGSQEDSTWNDCESILRDICNTDEGVSMSNEEAVSRFVRVTYMTRCINNKNKVGLPFMIGLVAKIGADSAVNPDHVDLLSDEF